MSDLISRQDALKPFCIAPDGTRIPEVDCDNFPVEFGVEFIKKHLLSLPSATCDDCIWHTCNYNKIDWDGEDGYISRQDALDAVARAIWHYPNECYKNLNVYEVAEALAGDAIKSLPSATSQSLTKPNKSCEGDLISRQDVIDAIMGEPTDAHYPSWYAKKLESLPSAEPKTKCVAQIRINRDDIEDLVNEKVNEIVETMSEPKTGEWVQDDDYICDQCGYHMIVGGGAYNYCPNCGARMLGKDDEG